MQALKQKLIIGNWKMHGTRSSLEQLNWLENNLTDDFWRQKRCIIALPASLLALAKDAQQKNQAKGAHHICYAAQDCHFAEKGPHTGDISALMLKDAGGDYVILGHCERRLAYGETNELIAAKAANAVNYGLRPIICIGETAQEREQQRSIAVIKEQLLASLAFLREHAAAPGFGYEHLPIIAYEPVWAIGSANSARSADIAQISRYIRQSLSEAFGPLAPYFPLLYGGSVNKENVALITQIAEVNGVLVGSASLKKEEFLELCFRA